MSTQPQFVPFASTVGSCPTIVYFIKTPVIITDRPEAVLRCGFIFSMFGAYQLLNVLILILLCVLFI